jgi:hypothetical protein
MPAAAAPFLTARNPYALAEAIAGGPIDWSAIPDPRAVLEDLLRTPYEQLFDPKFDSPVYLGFELHDGVMEAKKVKPAEANGETRLDDERFPALDLGEIHRLSDLEPYVGDPIGDVPVRSIVPSRAGGYVIEVGEAPMKRLDTLLPIYDEKILGRLIELIKIDSGWTPDGGAWTDAGQFFREAAGFFDPVQGNLGDCWLIAAMSSVAWAMPYTFAQRSRATGAANDRFTFLLEFVDPANGNKLKFEATDETLVWSGTPSPMYGHSSEAGESWPAIVEKAYAMWRANTTHDHPNLTVLNGGDPVHASAALTGRKPNYTGTSGTSATDLLNLVKANCVNYRTVNPMTAWTYGSGDDSPDKVVYADATIVANHAYSVLGWARGSKLAGHIDLNRYRMASRSGPAPAVGAALMGTTMASSRRAIDMDVMLPLRMTQDYIVLRNPWGNTEATIAEMSGVIPLRDVSFWRSIDLDVIDGVFAIEPATFKSYFAGVGVAL